MYDLDGEIIRWKSSFAAEDSLTPDVIDELESHLRDSFTELSKVGLEDHESFLIARLRIGLPAAIKEEFQKVNSTSTWNRRVFWILSGYAGGTAIASLITGIATTIASFGLLAGYKGTTVGILSIIIAMSLWSLPLLAFWKLKQRNFPSRSTAAIRLSMLAALILIGEVFSWSRFLLARSAPPEQISDFAFFNILGLWGIHLLVLIVCFVAIHRLSRNPVESQSPGAP